MYIIIDSYRCYTIDHLPLLFLTYYLPLFVVLVPLVLSFLLLLLLSFLPLHEDVSDVPAQHVLLFLSLPDGVVSHHLSEPFLLSF